MTNEHTEVTTIARAASPRLHEVIVRVGELEPLKKPSNSLTDRLMMEIVNQQLSVKAADAIWGRIESLAGEHRLTVPELLQSDSDQEILGCGLSRNKLKALKAVLLAASSGLLDEPALQTMGHELRVRSLTSIWGIGRWTADMIGIFFFHDPDIWPDGDVAARGMLHRITGIEETERFASAFAPYRSALARYMWRARDLPAFDAH